MIGVQESRRLTPRPGPHLSPSGSRNFARHLRKSPARQARRRWKPPHLRRLRWNEGCLEYHMTNSIAAGLLVLAGVTAAAPLTVLRPCVSLSLTDQRVLESGGVVSRALPAHDGQIAMFAATRVAADAETFVAATRAIADLNKSSFVVAIQRFSNPP